MKKSKLTTASLVLLFVAIIPLIFELVLFYNILTIQAETAEEAVGVIFAAIFYVAFLGITGGLTFILDAISFVLSLVSRFKHQSKTKSTYFAIFGSTVILLIQIAIILVLILK